MAAYLGPSIKLEQFLLEPQHSLVVQSWAPRELVYARVNADGYGIGWYADDDRPAIYTSPAPIWSAPNLPHLGRSLETDLWLANVRSATPGNPVNHESTQPFHDDDLIFMHNGYVQDFRQNCLAECLDFLDPGFLTEMRGNTDSEYLFAILRYILADDDDLSMEQAIAELFNMIENWTGDQDALLNLIITDGELIYATRHAINHDCPSLYYTTDDESFPDAQLIASEAMTETGLWQPVPEHHILVLSNDEPPELVAL
ncbi:MAG: ergothioneine biosynthesis protein EgtC [Granulosicoccaceae bacterium]|jgi:glutamine amidotransferase